LVIGILANVGGMKAKILVVDDEPDVLDLVTYNLGQAGFQTQTAADGAEALRKARSFTPDLILLDLMLPELDGLEVCKLLRRDAKTSAIPIIMLSARAGEMDRIVGLELGAVDYVPKPFSPRELVLRVKKRLEKNGGTASKNVYVFGSLQVDVSRHLVTVKGKRVELTATEFKLLALLVQRAGHVQTRDRLLRDVWEYESHIDTRTVDTHMRRLRDKLGAAAKFLDTVRGVGYRFMPDAA
jgi:two-component system phosphate regulon response regulator PhoB